MTTSDQTGQGPIEVEQDYLRELLKGAIRAYKQKPFTVVAVQMVEDSMLYVQYRTPMSTEDVVFPVGASVDDDVWEPQQPQQPIG